MNYQEMHDDSEARVAKAQQAAQDAKVWLTYVTAHRDIASVQANQELVLEFFNGEPLSIAALDEAFSNPTFRARIAFITPSEDRGKLLQEIKSLTGEIPLVTTYQSTDEVRSKVETLKREKEMRAKSPEELRQIIRDSKPAPVEVELPPQHTRASMLAMPGPAFKALCERYPLSVITKALNERR